MNSDCQKFQPLLPDYRWMNPGERQALDRHLAECADCRAELREIQAVGDWFVQARTTVPAGFADDVLAQITREPARAGLGRWAVVVLLGALTVEVAVASAVGVNPAPWWQSVVTAGNEFVRQWCLPVLAGWRELVTPLFGGWPEQVHAAWWGGAALVVVVFSWFTINRGRQENA